jgi:hypothetical protein
MQIVNKSFFNKQNNLHIPLSVNDPSGSITPNNETELDNLCVKIEREILLNALGLTLYNELKALDEITIEEVGNLRWKKLVQGDEYSEKVWDGLNGDYSLIAYRIFEQFTTDTNIRLSATGTTKVNAENATNQTPAYLIANSNLNFINLYQSEYLINPIVYDDFLDWQGCGNEIEKSLYGYLTDKKEDFPEWKPENFRIYETKNSFGI